MGGNNTHNNKIAIKITNTNKNKINLKIKTINLIKKLITLPQKSFWRYIGLKRNLKEITNPRVFQ